LGFWDALLELEEKKNADPTRIKDLKKRQK
jgi:hypothetical protein